MDNPDQSALYQVFQESFSKNIVGSTYPEYAQQPQTQQSQVQNNLWPPPPGGAGVPHQSVLPPQPHNPYPGSELDFPGSNPALDAMRGQVPAPNNFYGQEFYDMQHHQQPPTSMQGYYETSNNLMGMPPHTQPSYPASPSPASSWPQQYPVVPVPTKIEPPSTPVPGVTEGYFNPTPDPMVPPPPSTNEQYPGGLPGKLL